MPSNYWTGLVEGFQGRRESQLTRNLEQDAARRAQESEVFKYLLQSDDPEMRALALSGLLESASPGKRRGLGGYLGEVQGGQFYPLIRSRMEESVPEEPGIGGGPVPPRPGSAGMSTNQPVRPGSQPIQLPGTVLPPEPPPFAAGAPQAGPPEPRPVGAGQTPEAAAAAAPGAGPPSAPPESRFKRRGTGVPTAEEIAERQARIPLQTRIGMAQQYLSEEDARRAILGILGSPESARQFQLATFAVEDPMTGQPSPVSFDYTTGRFAFTDGTQVPRGARFVRMTGGATGGMTSTIRDSPEVRAQYGIDPTDVTPSGFWKIKQMPDGSATVMPSEYTPPPAYSGTTIILDASGNPVVAGVPRGGVPGGVIGGAPSPQPSNEQAAAQALLADVTKRITAAETPRLPGMPKRPLLPAQRDQIVKEAATAAGLPYQTYFELEQATRIPPARQVTPRSTAPAGTETSQPPVSSADKIRQRALEIERGKVPLVPSHDQGTPPPRR